MRVELIGLGWIVAAPNTTPIQTVRRGSDVARVGLKAVPGNAASNVLQACPGYALCAQPGYDVSMDVVDRVRASPAVHASFPYFPMPQAHGALRWAFTSRCDP